MNTHMTAIKSKMDLGLARKRRTKSVILSASKKGDIVIEAVEDSDSEASNPTDALQEELVEVMRKDAESKRRSIEEVDDMIKKDLEDIGKELTETHPVLKSIPVIGYNQPNDQHVNFKDDITIYGYPKEEDIQPLVVEKVEKVKEKKVKEKKIKEPIPPSDTDVLLDKMMNRSSGWLLQPDSPRELIIANEMEFTIVAAARDKFAQTLNEQVFGIVESMTKHLMSKKKKRKLLLFKRKQ